MSHTAECKVRLYLFGDDHTAKARLELDTGTNRLTGHGTARCAPRDNEVPEIGDEAPGRGRRASPGTVRARSRRRRG
ncbi:dsRBD fold-containing protein [Streptomyces goshikiensis]|uniref:dsRBD fold-containing protein n=1 Tax=Streptomyces goshikiensis TaxID=1942 RepID=UPI0036A3D641